MHSKAIFLSVKNTQDCVVKDQMVNRLTDSSLHTSTKSQQVFVHKNTTFSTFPTMLSKAFLLNVKNTQDCVVKDQRVNRWPDSSLHTSTISQQVFVLLPHCFQKLSSTMSSLDCLLNRTEQNRTYAY